MTMPSYDNRHIAAKKTAKDGPGFRASARPCRNQLISPPPPFWPPYIPDYVHCTHALHTDFGYIFILLLDRHSHIVKKSSFEEKNIVNLRFAHFNKNMVFAKRSMQTHFVVGVSKNYKLWSTCNIFTNKSGS